MAPDTDDARRSLAADQRRLLDALAGGPVPPGFDPGRIALAAGTLLNKRRRTAGRRWPALAGVPDFADRFAAYAAATPLPPGGTADDGRQFFAHLRAHGGLTDAAVVEHLVDRAVTRGVAVGQLAVRRFAVAVRRPWPGRRVWVWRV